MLPNRLEYGSAVQIYSWEAFEPTELQPGGIVTNAFLKLSFVCFRSAARFVRSLPYSRNTDPDDALIVLTQGRGTCSTKHALMRRLALEQRLNIALVIGIYEMTEHEITLCTRRPLQQLTVTIPSGLVRVKAHNVTVPESAEPVEWVIVATKAYDAEGAAKWFPDLCAHGPPVAVLQNGVEHRERFAPYVSRRGWCPRLSTAPRSARPTATCACAEQRACASKTRHWAGSWGTSRWKPHRSTSKRISR